MLSQYQSFSVASSEALIQHAAPGLPMSDMQMERKA